MSRYADVLLPLALGGTLTYTLPPMLAADVRVGSRVLVPLGRTKVYSGIVVRLHDEAPGGGFELKDVREIVDAEPLLVPRQVQLWQWMANYYMCTQGEVMKAALPAGLRLESETGVLRNPDFSEPETLSERERILFTVLSPDKAQNLDALRKAMGVKSVHVLVRRLMERGAARVEERMERLYRPRTETHVRLAEAYRSASALNALLPTLGRAPRQESLLLAFLDMSGESAVLTTGNEGLRREVSKRELMEHRDGSEAALTALRARGILETYAFEVARLRAPKAMPESLQKQLNPQQEQALEAVRGIFREKDVCLLHGVTSSGKTEVFIRLIKETLARGEQVLYLLPEIALTTQITGRLGRVFGDGMGVYHSKFPDAERVELWKRQLGDAPFPLILGARSALFLPYQKLGLVIVDEEHETSYKQQEPAPRYNARDTALVLARMYGAKVLLGTATPSLETYHNAQTGRYGLVEMTTRYGDVAMPEIVVEDVAELKRKRLMPTPFSPRLREAMQRALENREQIILFQNRRGYSPVLECRTCGWSPRCTRCDVPLTFHQREGRLVCHYCGASYPVPKQCPQCEDTELRDVGYGTEKIEAAVHAVFPAARTARMDLDTTRTRNGYDAILDDFAAGRTDILIGTQMVTKGLDFARVSVVGILNADQLLNKPDFRAYERAFQMMSQVAGRAGRRGKRGLVILQTRQAALGVVEQVVRGDYTALYRGQMAERRAFGYPPFVRLIEITLRHSDERICAAAAAQFAALLRPHFPEEELLGPDRPAVARVQTLYLRRLLLKVRPDLPASGVRRTLLAARDITLGMEPYRRVLIHFDVDPI
ncbi:MAG: primosomal protein N' [Alloprevotella sp.]|nr:primosomal protein N' [Alloprevotella sp.]